LSLEKLSQQRVLAGLVKFAVRLEDPRVQLYLFFLEQLRPFSRGELLRFLRINVLEMSGEQLDRALSYLHEKKFLEKRRCGKQVLYYPIL
jgi:hypothetical protein